MQRKFMGGRPPVTLEGKTVIMVDDGIATGNTLLTTISMLRKGNPEKLVIAVPVASESSVEKLRPLVDEMICLLIPPYFPGVGAFYREFEQMTDEEVMANLQEIQTLADT
jgi:predicted phosphoribosyltransferase